MLLPSVYKKNKNEVSLFDELFDWPMMPMFEDMDRIGRKLYGKHENMLMRMDVHEKEGEYELDIDLPGFKKDEISLSLNDGYLLVAAAKGMDEEEKDKKGKLIRQERYAGSMQRSVYVGDTVKEEDIHAKFEDGVLHIELPKTEEEKKPERKLIAIEG